MSCTEKKVSDWIYENLSGRYYFGEVFSPNLDTGNTRLHRRVAFEVHSEASYFALALPDINKF